MSSVTTEAAGTGNVWKAMLNLLWTLEFKKVSWNLGPSFWLRTLVSVGYRWTPPSQSGETLLRSHTLGGESFSLSLVSAEAESQWSLSSWELWTCLIHSSRRNTSIEASHPGSRGSRHFVKGPVRLGRHMVWDEEDLVESLPLKAHIPTDALRRLERAERLKFELVEA